MTQKSRGDERKQASCLRLAQLAHGGRLLRGNVVVMKRRCGKKGCRCQRGDLHVSLYLAQSQEGRKRMVYVAKRFEESVKEWVRRYQEAKQLLEEISISHWDQLRRRAK